VAAGRTKLLLLHTSLLLLQDPRDTRGTGRHAGGQGGTPKGPGSTETPRGPEGTAGGSGETPRPRGKRTGGNNGGIGASRKATRTQHFNLNPESLI
jgi:hypothetical protein